jgi:probable F420-dependent oxidoreductase
MNFGLLVPNWAPFDQQVMIDVALEAEAAGFDRVFYTDHLLNPHVDSDGLPELTVESWSLISYVAARTSQVRLGTAITPMAVRPPALLAKQIATIDNLSGGRIDVGVGAGWAPGSFRLLNSEFGTAASRARRLREGITLMTRLWTEEVVDFDGEFYEAQAAVVGPKPVQRPYPPVWLGGFRDSLLKLAGELADGWIPWHRSPAVFKECLGTVRMYAASAGRDPSAIVPATVCLVVPDKLRDAALDLGQGKPPNITVSTADEAVAAYEAAGAELFVAFLYPAEDARRTVRELGARLLSA